MTATKDTPFGVQLRQYRTALGLTQEELAEQARLSPRGIRALERGERTAPRRETVDLLADALQLDEEERLSFQAAGRTPAAVAGESTGNPPRRAVRPSALLRGVALAALILLAGVAAEGVRTVIGTAHPADRVVGAPVPSWPDVAPQSSPLSDPVAVTSDAGGDLFVLDARNNLIHTFAPDGTPLATWGGTGTGKGEFLAPSALAVDTSGRVYVADTGNNRVQVFSFSGQWQASWTGKGTTGGPMRNPSGVAAGAGGRIYVADTYNGRVLVSSPAGRLTGPRIIRTGAGPTSVASDRRGNLYVLTNRGIQAFSPSGVRLNEWPPSDVNSLAVDGRGSIWGVGGGPVAHFTAQGYLLSRSDLPGTKDLEGISFDGRGHMYLADPGAGQVEEVGPAGQIVARFGGHASRPAVDRAPGAAATDRTGNVYVARAGGRIEEYSPGGALVHAWIFPGASPASAPGAIALDSHGAVIAVDTAASRVWELAPDGAVLHQWGGPGSGPGAFNVPAGVTVDSRGRVYIADAGNARIQVFSSRGHFQHAIALAAEAGSSGITPYPFGLAIDAHDNLYVADALLDTVFKLSPQGRLLARIGSSGSGRGQLRSPEAVALDRQGRVYVADTGNNRVEVFSGDGALLQIVGGSGQRGRTFDRPSGVTVDRAGTLYVVDAGHHRVQKFLPSVGAKRQ